MSPRPGAPAARPQTSQKQFPNHIPNTQKNPGVKLMPQEMAI